MSATSAMPQRKVMAGGLAGAFVMVVVWALGEFAEILVPGEIAVAMSTVVSFALSYLVPNAPSNAT